MTDLPFHDGHESTATRNGAQGRKRCRRHVWLKTMDESGRPYADCANCDATYDLTTSRRSKNNAVRGKAIQRKRIEGLGGKNLAGNNENLDGIGTMFAYESKSGGSFSERYWRWIKGIPTRGDQVPVLIVTDAPGPGHRARSIVVVSYDDWRDLHGEL
jgi:hypothetical protein